MMENTIYLCLFIGFLLLHLTGTFVVAYPNVAEGKFTSQSTVKIKQIPGSQTPLKSNLATDGNRDTNGDTSPYCAQTLDKINSWWKINLETSHHINEIKMWLRSRKSGPPLGINYKVYLSDSGSCGTNSVCNVTSPVNETMTATCTGVGQWIVICRSTTTDRAIILCEVEIYGCAKEKYGANCEFQCAHCLNSTCDINDGSCPGECESNYWGINCDKQCFHANCSEAVCEKSTGLCASCYSGYWGNDCLSQCPDNCKYNVCKRESGHCFDCKTGFHNSTCNELCSTMCGDEGCEQSGFRCLNCVRGYWGDTCAYACPDHCDELGCTQDDGQCHDCHDGYWNNTCMKHCGKCLQASCTQNNGSCIYGCQDGYVPPKCVCSINCKNEECNENTRDCLFACKDGYWGGNCSKSCSHCKNSKCDTYHGMCLNGCANNTFWGTYCQTCPSRCVNNTCDQESGLCHGCLAGYRSELCNESCSSNCIDQECFQYDSVCIKGCTSRYTGSLCMQEVPVIDNDITGAVTAGFVIPLLLIAIAFVAAFVVIKRRRLRKDNLVDKEFEDIQLASARDNETSEAPECININEQTESNGNVYGNVASEDNLSFQQGIAVDSLGVQIRQKQTNATFADEYKKFPVGLQYPHEVGKEKLNIPKNRFAGTFPYDHSRVVLDILPERPHSDYINCSYIESPEGKKNYIAAQGPKKNTLGDFWRMIWQLQCGTVIMLTNLTEGTKPKCERYWPESDIMLTAGKFKLKLSFKEERSVYTIRKIVLSQEGTEESRTVTQFHFMAWPDHGVADPIQLTKFHRHVQQYDITNTGPLVVHCSAGIGRTGTYIALDALYEFGQKYGRLDIPGFVMKMRHDRKNMIQTLDQYKLLHEALYEEFMYPSSAIPRTSYLEEYPKIINGKPENQTRINKEFEIMMTMRQEYPDSEYKAAFSKENHSKNRGTTIALEKYRPLLNTKVPGSTNYINAVTIPGCMKGSMYILTQIPLENTVFDFWRMMYEQESNVVVKLNDVPTGQPPVDILPPLGDQFTIGSLTVGMEAANTKSPDVVENTVIVTDTTSKETKTVKMFEVQNWEASNELPPNIQLLLKLVDSVSRWQEQTEQRIVTVMCLNGSTCSGLYCAISKLLEQLRTEQEVDVYQAAREIQYRCPQCLMSNEQYSFCYQTIKEHLSDDDVYGNM